MHKSFLVGGMEQLMELQAKSIPVDTLGACQLPGLALPTARDANCRGFYCSQLQPNSKLRGWKVTQELCSFNPCS